MKNNVLVRTHLIAMLVALGSTLAGCGEPEHEASLQGAVLLKTIGKFNIVEFNGQFYGAPHGAAIDWPKDDLIKVQGMLVGSSAEEVERAIRRLPGYREQAVLPAGQPQPILINTVGHYNVVTFNGNVYGALQGVDIDWNKDDLPKVRGMIVGTSAIGVEVVAVWRLILSRLPGSR